MGNSIITPVVLCGGSGTRLWPLSRTIYPKQLLPLVDNMSMLQNTLLRVSNLSQHNPAVIICNQEYRFIVAEQLKEIDCKHAEIFLEPEGRNTAPAVTLAALYLNQKNLDAMLLVMPADHIISDGIKLAMAIQEGEKLARQGYLVTFGVVPTKPETGYGYILRGESLPSSTNNYTVKRFVEKPTIDLAKKYITSKDYFWNSGMFMFRASTFLQTIQAFAPDILSSCQDAFSEMAADRGFYWLGKKFLATRSESIDYAVLEKSKDMVVVPLESGWSDIGSWNVLWEINPKDLQGNVLQGQVYIDQVNNSYLRAEKRLLAVVGLSDIVVIETLDAVLIAHRNSCQEVKSMVSLLKSNKCTEVNEHRRVYRPWGYFEVLNQGEGYQVKHILVKPGAKLSLQVHRFRAEHWVITKGTAWVTRDDVCFELSENQSVYIPAMMKHRIENKKTKVLELIEVQTGQYLGEDDIIRFEDIYGREEVVVV